MRGILAVSLIVLLNTGCQAPSGPGAASFVQLGFGQQKVPAERLVKYVAFHPMVLVTAAGPAREWQPGRYVQEFTVNEVLAGHFEGMLSATYTCSRPLEKGTRVILLGIWHKTGFHVIAFGDPREDALRQLRAFRGENAEPPTHAAD